MNTLRIFTPSVFKTFSNDVLDHLFLDGGNNDYSSRPYTNIIEADDKFTIELALPGFAKEQINMKFHQDILTVSANVDENNEDGMKYLVREYGLRSFEKRFTIPKSIDTDNISAEFKNGILAITVPKRAEAIVKQPKEVQIN
jgi:HSP20 family protein